jgi:LCP family protein required for cell wall assembly
MFAFFKNGLEFINNRKKAVLVAGGILLMLAAVIVMLVVAKGCSEGSPVDNPIVEGNGSAGSMEGGEGENLHGDNGRHGEGGEVLPGGAGETGGGADRIPPGVTDLQVLRSGLVSENSINILILGQDQLYTLMDTVGIISIDKETKTIKIIMIPRDTYIQYNDRVLDFMRQYGKYNLDGAFKINYSYYLGYLMHEMGWELDFKGKFDRHSYGVSFMTQVVEEKFGLTIHDFIKVDTQGFVEAVDLFGGVDIYVPYDMNYEDPEQDLYIHLEEGFQHLDGKQAEGFVRFRTGIDEEGNEIQYGDIARKNNQIAFLKAFFEQHATLSNLDKIPGFLQILGKRVWSSINVGDVLTRYISLGADIISEGYTIESLTLNGNSKIINNSWYIIISDEVE